MRMTHDTEYLSQSVRKLEELVQHQERQIQELSDVVAGQWQDIDKLRKAIQVLQKEMVSMTQDRIDGQGEAMTVTEIALRDKPPHY